MNKFLDNIYKYFVWIILLFSIIGYFAYRVLQFEGEIKTALLNWQSWINVLFIIMLNLITQEGCWNSGISYGLESVEFSLANELNDKIIIKINNEMDEFRMYVKELNKRELSLVQEDFLFSVGDKKVEELTEEEKKKYNNLKPLQHDIFGFNLPLYYEQSKKGKVSYKATYEKNKGKLKARLAKTLFGLLFAAMTINMVLYAEGLANALLSILIISVGLCLTAITSFIPRAFELKYELPKKVLLKKTLFDSYLESLKNEQHTVELLDENHNLNI